MHSGCLGMACRPSFVVPSSKSFLLPCTPSHERGNSIPSPCTAHRPPAPQLTQGLGQDAYLGIPRPHHCAWRQFRPGQGKHVAGTAVGHAPSIRPVLAAWGASRGGGEMPGVWRYMKALATSWQACRGELVMQLVAHRPGWRGQLVCHPCRRLLEFRQSGRQDLPVDTKRDRAALDGRELGCTRKRATSLRSVWPEVTRLVASSTCDRRSGRAQGLKKGMAAPSAPCTILTPGHGAQGGAPNAWSPLA